MFGFLRKIACSIFMAVLLFGASLTYSASSMAATMVSCEVTKADCTAMDGDWSEIYINDHAVYVCNNSEQTTCINAGGVWDENNATCIINSDYACRAYGGTWNGETQTCDKSELDKKLCETNLGGTWNADTATCSWKCPCEISETECENNKGTYNSKEGTCVLGDEALCIQLGGNWYEETCYISDMTTCEKLGGTWDMSTGACTGTKEALCKSAGGQWDGKNCVWSCEVDTTSCEPGEYYDGKECQKCPAGTFSTTTTATSCTVCATGSYNTSSGQTSCTACSAGKTASGSAASNHDSSSDCTKCSNSENASTWASQKWATNNSVSPLCRIATCASGYEVSANVDNNVCNATATETDELCELTKDKCGELGGVPNSPYTICGNLDPATCYSSGGFFNHASDVCYKNFMEWCTGLGYTWNNSTNTCSNVGDVSDCQVAQETGQHVAMGDQSCTMKWCTYALYCDPGYYYDGEACKKCTAGYYCTGGTAQPQQCTAGHYCPEGASAQTDCGVGHYCPSAGMSSYYSCSAGTFSTSATATSCTVCATGSYNTQSGQTTCTACPAGKTTSGSAASNHDNSSDCTACSNAAHASTWASQTWATNNSVSALCKISSCATGYTVNNSNNNNACVGCSYTVVYNSNKPSNASGTISGSTASSSHTYGTAKNLTTNGYSLTGWTFMGWNTAANGTGATYANGASVTNLTSTCGGSVTLYAQWQARSVEGYVYRNYNSSDTTVMGNIPCVGDDDSCAVYDSAMPRIIDHTAFTNNNLTTLAVPTRTGYTFTGIYDARSGGTKYYNADLSSARNWDKTVLVELYAQWSAGSYTCAAGQYLPANSTSCATCPVGSICPGGTYSFASSYNQGIYGCLDVGTNFVGTGTMAHLLIDNGWETTTISISAVNAGALSSASEVGVTGASSRKQCALYKKTLGTAGANGCSDTGNIYMMFNTATNKHNLFVDLIPSPVKANAGYYHVKNSYGDAGMFTETLSANVSNAGYQEALNKVCQPCPGNYTSAAGATANTQCYRSIVLNKNSSSGTLSTVISANPVTDSGGTANASIKCYYNTACTLPSASVLVPASGYKMSGGWGTSSSCTATTTSITPTDTSATVTYYACRNTCSYTNSSATQATSNVCAGTCNTGYSTSGGSNTGTSASCSGTSCSCSIRSYTIRLNKNGGGGSLTIGGVTATGATDATATCNYGSALTLPAWSSSGTTNNTTNITSSGQVFLGWSTSDACTSYSCVKSVTTCPTANVTYYAVWSPCTCTNGTGASGCSTSVSNNSCNISWSCNNTYYGPQSTTNSGGGYTATCSACPNSYASGSDSGRTVITNCYVLRNPSCTQNACSNPDTTGCSGYTCASSCTCNTTQYKVYSNTAGTGDGTVSGTTSYSCTKAVATLTSKSGYYVNGTTSCPACSSAASGYNNHDANSQGVAYCWKACATQTGQSVTGRDYYTATDTCTYTNNNYTISLNKNTGTENGTTSVYTTYNTAVYNDSARTNVMSTSANPIGAAPGKVYTVTYNGNNGTVGTTTSANTTSKATFNGFYSATSGGTQYIDSNRYITSAGLTAGKAVTNDSSVWYAQFGTQSSVTLPKATRSGYVLTGWYTATSGGTKRGGSGDTYTPTGSETLYAQWSQCTCTNGTGASGCSTSVSNNSCNITWSCSDGYFNATQSATNNGGGYTATCSACSGLTVPTSGWVTGGTYTSVSPRSANTNCRYTPPSKATPADCAGITPNTVSYTSSGWNTGLYTVTAPTGYSPVNSPSASPSCSANTYSISYVLDSGTAGSSAPTTATYDTSFTVSNPTRTGYTFAGWKITNMDSVTHYYGSSNTTNTSISWTKETSFKNLRSTSGTVTFTAQWCQNCSAGTGCNCSLTAQGTSCTYSTSAQSTYTLTSGNGTRTPVCASCTGTAGTGTSACTASSTNASNQCVFSATIKTGYTGSTSQTGTAGVAAYTCSASANTYSISYVLDSGTAGSSAPTTATYDTSFTVSNPTRTGYTFAGWKITNMDSVTHYYGSSNTTSTSISWTKETSFKNLRSTSGTVTFTAQWCQNCSAGTGCNCSLTAQGTSCTYSTSAQSTYTLTSGNGTRTPVCAACTGTAGTGTSACTASSTNASNQCVFSATIKTGYTGSTSQTGTAGVAAYTCSASANTYTLTLNKNGGSGTIKNSAGTTYTSETAGTMTCTTNSAISLPTWSSGASSNNTTNITSSGQVFLGWSTSDACTSYSCVKSVTTCPTANVTYYAVWSPCTCTNGTGASGCSTGVSNNSCNISWSCNNTYYGPQSTTNSGGGYTATCSACSGLSGVNPSGGTYTSVSPRSANTNCRYKAPDKVIDGCYSVTSQLVTYSGSAWPATTYAITANKGYVISNNNTASATCTLCGGGKYQDTDGSTSTSCSAITAGYYCAGGAKTATPSSSSDSVTGASCGGCSTHANSSAGASYCTCVSGYSIGGGTSTTSYSTSDRAGTTCLGKCNPITLDKNADAATPGMIAFLYKITDATPWYSNETCTTTWSGGDSVKPTRTGYEFRGFYNTPVSDMSTSTN